MTDERGVAYGFTTKSDGGWTAFYGGNATNGNATDKVDAMIAVWDWINSQQNKGVIIQGVSTNIDRGPYLEAGGARAH
jgi:hypothetical protein